jgi:5'-phosphate synthase pdxT subunit
VRVGVLAVQGASDLHLQALSRLGVDATGVRKPSDLGGVDAIVIPGGESTTISMMLDATGLAEPLGDLLAAGMPALGTCAGMILLAAEVTDGRSDQRSYHAIDISVQRNAWGRQIESFETSLAVQELGAEPVPAVFIRAPGVTRVGADVEVLATHKDAPVMCRQGSVVVTAFHPELAEDLRVHRFFVESAIPIRSTREEL